MSQFVETNIQIRNEVGYRFDELDWHKSVWITLVYRDDFEVGLAGHHLLFHLGAGKRPGIVTGKQQAKKLCGFTGRAIGVSSERPCSIDNSDDCILDIPRLAQLDSNRPSDVVPPEPGRKAVSAVCFGYGFDPPQFWACSRSAVECNKLRKAEKREENGNYRVRTICKTSDVVHCFRTTKTACAPTADTCVLSRKEWLSFGKDATPCEPATEELLRAAATGD